MKDLSLEVDLSKLDRTLLGTFHWRKRVFMILIRMAVKVLGINLKVGRSRTRGKT